MEADSTLRRHLGLPSTYVVPLGLSHGVDFGQWHGIMDSVSVEPLHWAYNPRLLEKAAGTKPAVGIPHPFLLASQGLPEGGGSGTLVVGPPPGPKHDRDLLELIRDAGRATILVKPKQNFGRSAAFWRDNGFDVATIADEGDPSYESMARLFSRFDRVAGCTFSSALFFAAALGKPIDLIRGHRCRVWEIPDIDVSYDFGSGEAMEVGRAMASDDQPAKIALSRKLLGAELSFDRETIRRELDRAISDLREPLHFSGRYPKAVRRMLGELALRTGKAGLVSRSFSDALKSFRRHEVFLQDFDDIGLWVEGRTPDNPRLTKLPYRAGVTIPGDAVEGYPREVGT